MLFCGVVLWLVCTALATAISSSRGYGWQSGLIAGVIGGPVGLGYVLLFPDQHTTAAPAVRRSTLNARDGGPLFKNMD